jgi:peptidyl-prolyl cis-trans isomerase C
VRVSAIIVKDKKLAADVAKQALGEQGKTNKGFRELVTKHSVDEASKTAGGDLRYFSSASTEVPAPVVKAAFGLAQTGDVAGPIEAGDGRFYVIKQTGRRQAINKTYEQVKRQIQNRLYRDVRTESQKEFIEGLRKKAKIETFDANLAKVRIDASAAVGGDPRSHGGVGVDGLGPADHGASGPGPTDEGDGDSDEGGAE